MSRSTSRNAAPSRYGDLVSAEHNPLIPAGYDIAWSLVSVLVIALAVFALVVLARCAQRLTSWQALGWTLASSSSRFWVRSPGSRSAGAHSPPSARADPGVSRALSWTSGIWTTSCTRG
jgi:hypothetical protein